MLVMFCLWSWVSSGFSGFLLHLENMPVGGQAARNFPIVRVESECILTSAMDCFPSKLFSHILLGVPGIDSRSTTPPAKKKKTVCEQIIDCIFVRVNVKCDTRLPCCNWMSYLSKNKLLFKTQAQSTFD